MAKEKRILAKGYVMPLTGFGYLVISLIFMACLIGIAIVLAPDAMDGTVICIALALLCGIIPLVGLAFDKCAMRYSITPDCVQSRDLFRMRCQLADAQVKQIELLWVHEVNNEITPEVIYMVCSDKYYAQDKYIARNYHRQSQVVVRVTRRNFRAAQAYLARMGVPIEFANFRALAQAFRWNHQTYRRTDGEWKQY